MNDLQTGYEQGRVSWLWRGLVWISSRIVTLVSVLRVIMIHEVLEVRGQSPRGQSESRLSSQQETDCSEI